jgi:hypothetical protein
MHHALLPICLRCEQAAIFSYPWIVWTILFVIGLKIKDDSASYTRMVLY